jgi:type IV secretion system protein VirB10
LFVAGLGLVMTVTGAAQQQDDSRDSTLQDNAPAPQSDSPAHLSSPPRLAPRPAGEYRRESEAEAKVSIPAGAQILLRLEHAITTKSAKVGDPVFAVTTFPYVQNERMLIPAGTYVQGRISAIQRAGRVKGRAEMLFHFTTLIYPNGYTVMLPGAVENVPGMEHSTMKDQEGTIRQDGNKGHDVATAASTAVTGAVIGAAADGIKGAGIGGAGGAVVGTAIALLSRGKDLRLEQGTAVQMVVQRPIDIDANRVSGRTFRSDIQRLEPR